MGVLHIMQALNKAGGGSSGSAPDPGVTYKDLFVLAGQSNCGRSRTSEMTSGQLAIYDPALVRTKIYNKPVSTSALNFLNAGTNTQLLNAVNADEFGSEVSLFKSFEDLDTKERFLIKQGVGSSDLATQWNSRTPGTLYTDLITQMNAALTLIRATGAIPRLVAFIWMQGENDATNNTWASNYLTNLTNFFTDISTWASGQGIVPGPYKKIIGRINGFNDTSEVYRAVVRQAQADYCGNSGNNAVLIDTDSYPLKDAVHYSATGQIQFGIDIFNLVKTL